MGLLKCQDCLGEVSNDAEACPHCGKPFNGFARVFGSLARFIMFVCIVGITMRICGR